MGEDSLHVGEMFAGVGGFRLGLEGPPSKDWETEFLKFEETGFKVVWSNQWEPGSSKQWASKIYEERFGNEGHSNDDIHSIALNKGEMAETIREQIPELDVLVGGFPCQDYSVARTVSGELGIKGEKGKLWIPIRNIIRHKRPRPKFVLLENVPRLLNSPANARGLNFAIILNDLIEMGYEVEWRVINAADYGMPQQRNRVFILAYKTPGSSKTDSRGKINGPEKFGILNPKTRGPMSKWLIGKSTSKSASEWETGPFAEAFPVTGDLGKSRELVPQDLGAYTSKSSPFGNAGYAWRTRLFDDGKVGDRVNVFWSTKAKSDYEGEKMTIRENIMVQKGESDYDESYEVDKAELKKWKYEKGEKREFRIRKSDLEKYPELAELYAKCKKSKDQKVWNNHRADFEKILGADGSYNYDEGAIAFPDSIDKPSRTVVTAEIGKSASRMRHLIKHDDGTYRTLFPIETERLNMFPDNWTKMNDEKGKQIPDSKRGFMMGNALVVGIIQRLREPIRELITRRRGR
jgi:DNA (cytosine-5)-methyltransferase 1